MASSFDMSGFEKLQKDLQKLQTKAPQTAEKCANELVSRLYAMTVKRTPVGDYEDTYDLEYDGDTYFLVMSDKQGGTLRRGWIIRGPYYFGNNYVCELINPVEYAPYVEYGHRQTPGRYVPAIDRKLTASWVKGYFMLTKSLQDLERLAPKVIQKNVDTMMKEVFG